MDFDSEITRAITAHQSWKDRLNRMLSAGTFEIDAVATCRDDYCQFGRWLNSAEPGIRSSHRWKCVKDTHASFHNCAGEVVRLGLAGHLHQARRAMSYGSAFWGVSTKLNLELAAWKRETSGREPGVPAHS